MVQLVVGGWRVLLVEDRREASRPRLYQPVKVLRTLGSDIGARLLLSQLRIVAHHQMAVDLLD